MTAALTAATAATSKISQGRARYLQELTSLAKAVEALDDVQPCPASDGADVPGSRSPEALLTAGEGSLALLRGLHRAATARDHPDALKDPARAQKAGLAKPALAPGPAIAKGPVDADRVTAARQLLFALRANPTLGRLFRFVVDLEVDLEVKIDGMTLLERLGLTEGAAGEPVDARRFAFLACSLGSPEVVVESHVWTVTKFGYARGKVARAWPALREDMELTLSGGGKVGTRAKVVAQSDGLVRLGQTLDSAAAPQARQRYDLVTVDAAFALDAHLREHLRSQAAADAAVTAAGPENPVDPAPLASSAPLFISRGLCLIDRWRGAAVTAEIINASAFAKSEGTDARIVDAEDLATGYRVLVGLLGAKGPDGKEKVSWRSLMNRKVIYEDVGPAKAKIEAALAQLGLSAGSERRLLSDAASATTPSRTRLGADKTWAHPEEALAAWEGEPLALACKTDTVAVVAGADLTISRTYGLDLPVTARFPLLRYGKAYQVMVGTVWLGGVGVSSHEAADLAADDHRLPSPVTGVSHPYRRLLRHEPVLPPVLLLPVGFAARKDRYVRQSGPVAVLRAQRQGDAIDQDANTWRILMPPRHSLDEVWRHGVLDAEAAHPTHPDGAFLQVAIDEPWGGGDFPVYGRSGASAATAASETPLERLSTGTPAKVWEAKGATWKSRDEPGKPGGPKRPVSPDGQGEVVFMAREKGGPARGSREHPYYPDPAAERLVIALRPARRPSAEGYFAGSPLVVDVSPGPNEFRAALPVALAFERAAGRRTDPPQGQVLTHADFCPEGARIAYTDGRRLANAPFPDAVKVRLVTIRLHEGEHVAADAWFAPRATTLRRWFDLPETTVATLGVSDTPLDDRVVAAKLDDWFALGARDGQSADTKPITRRVEALLALKGAERSSLDRSWIAEAGLPVKARTVAAVAGAFADALERRPVTQLSGVRTIEAVHAVPGPVRAPAFDRSKANIVYERSRQMLALTRYPLPNAGETDLRSDLLKAYEELAAKPEADVPDPFAAWQVGIPAEATGLLLAGKIQIDRDTSAQFEVLASVVSPQGSPIDDPSRRRPEALRLAGDWPRDEVGAVVRAEQLFGFRVAPDGRVTLPTSSVTLLRIENIDAWGAASRFSGLETLDLAAEQRKALESAALAGGAANRLRVTSFDPFKDTLARKLRISLRAAGRHGELVRRIVPDDRTGRIEDPPIGTLTSDEAEVWLPATRRPGPPAVQTVLPSFVWDEVRPKDGGPVSLVREARIRVWLDRPWFSSGEGERLGIVLWPPRLSELTTEGQAKLTEGFVARPEGGEGAEAWMDLSDYADDVLGAAGKFVTRWGADAIRNPPEKLGPFMSDLAFKDIPQKGSPVIQDGPGYEDEVTIPILPPAKAGENHEIQPVESLTAALVTYVPRFDVDRELWYVDIALNPEIIPGLVEPWVRFGVVRFQANAIRGRRGNGCVVGADRRHISDLRASAPVAVWGQILPKRTLTLSWLVEPAPGQDGWLDVQVTGPYASRVDPDGRPLLPRFRVALASTTVRAGLRTETISQWASLILHAPGRTTVDQGESWRLPLKVVGDARDLDVLVEEEEAFPSTDDEAVPTEGETVEGKWATRPRYRARLSVPRTYRRLSGAQALK